MANITDTNGIAFSNTKIRVAADKYMQLYWFAKAMVATWNADNLNAIFTNDTSAVIDNATVDGRMPITGADVQVLISHLNTLITDMEATSFIKRNQVNKIAVNPTS